MPSPRSALRQHPKAYRTLSANTRLTLGLALLTAGAMSCKPAPAEAPGEPTAAAPSAEAAPATANPNAAAEEAAIRDAQAWLGLIDQAKYAESWQAAAAVFQSGVSAEQWEGAVTHARGPLGALTSRQLLGSQFNTSLPGAPDGNYVVIQYGSAFANKAKAKEIVTTAQAPDGSWKVAGYFIQ